MRNGKCVTPGVMLSEAKHLNRENRLFALLRPALSLEGVTTIPHSPFSIQCAIAVSAVATPADR